MRDVECYAKLCNEAREYRIPAIGECFPTSTDNLTEEEMYDRVLHGTRIIAELEADPIKMFYTYKFKDMVQGCPIPILGLGGHTTSNPIDSLQLAEDEIKDGFKGVVFGRNALLRKGPIAYQLALNEVVKRGMSPTAAIVKIEL